MHGPAHVDADMLTVKFWPTVMLTNQKGPVSTPAWNTATGNGGSVTWGASGQESICVWGHVLEHQEAPGSPPKRSQKLGRGAGTDAVQQH